MSFQRIDWMSTSGSPSKRNSTQFECEIADRHRPFVSPGRAGRFAGSLAFVAGACLTFAASIASAQQPGCIGCEAPPGVAGACAAGSCYNACAPVVQGVQCDCSNRRGEAHWNQWRPIPFNVYDQGEYVSPPRIPHIPQYRVRVDDELEFIYRFTRELSSQQYELQVGDVIAIESMTDETLNRGNLATGNGIEVLDDGTITLRLLGQVRAAGRTISELRDDLETRYEKYYKVPAITVAPVRVNAAREDLRNAVNGGVGFGGQRTRVRVTPEGSVQLPGIGSVPAVGLTMDEIAMEVNERYKRLVSGIETTPTLFLRAPSYVFVVGEVRTPGRYTVDRPTDVMQAITLAGSWLHSGNLRQIVVFRRDDNWRLMATKLDLRGAFIGKRPCPADNIMLRDLDVVVVPKNTAQLSADVVNLIFTQNLYGVLPLTANLNFSKASSL